MTRLGGITKRYYIETRGIKVTGGEFVKAGTILTRQGHRWQPGLNVTGRTSLTAACGGQVYFTRKKNSYNKLITVINIRATENKN